MIAILALIATQVVAPVQVSYSGGATAASLGAFFLKLDASNAPVTGTLSVLGSTPDQTMSIVGDTANNTGRTTIAAVNLPSTYGINDAVLVLKTNSSTYQAAPFISRNDAGEELRYGIDGSAAAGTFWGLTRAHLSSINATDGLLAIGTTLSQPLIFVNNSVEAARFDGSLNLLIGNTTNGTGRASKLFVSSSSASDFSFTGSNSAAGNGAFADYSDDTGDDAFIGVTGSTGFSVLGATRAKTTVLVSRATNGMVVGTNSTVDASIATNNLVRWKVRSDGPTQYTSQGLPTCGASLEWSVAADSTSGVSTAHRSRLCMCTSNGSAVYAWQNIVSGTVGNTTTCND